jgi:hypothetical protein
MDERLMIPQSRTALPKWEYTWEGEVVGWVEEIRIGHSTRRFYRATGVHPVTGGRVVLENGTDREERVWILMDFHEHPDRYHHHLR